MIPSDGLLPLLAIVLGLLLVPSVAPAFEGKEYLRAGKASLEAGRYDEAAGSLSAAANDFPLLADYALFYLSEAYVRAGLHGKALDAARRLIADHPGSPLIRKARRLEVLQSKAAGEDPSGVMGAYVRDYPDDEEMRFMFAQILRQSGEREKADAAFKALCVKAGSMSSSACSELGPKSLRVADHMELAANLMKRYDFKGAERELRKALSLDGGKRRTDILRNLGHALFRQKEYAESAALFARVSDTYYQARSLYRAGNEEGFEAALADLLKKHDNRAADLLMAVAADKCREGRYEEALAAYRDIERQYPSSAEDAMWGAGWTAYRSGDYRLSADTFSRLYRRHEDPRYLYWQARSLEQLGEKAEALYDTLGKIENNYYSALSRMRFPGETGTVPDISPASFSADTQRPRERIDALLSLGMSREAVAELSILALNLESNGDLYYVMSRFHELGEYRRAVGLASKLPYSARLHRFSYPLAFWEDVKRIAGRHEVDPMLALSVMREESRFDPEAHSVAGARGLMQLMPQTAFRLDRHLKMGIVRESSLHDPKTNINLGVYYLRSLIEEFHSLSHALAAYNAGEAAVRKWEKQLSCKSGDEFVEEIPYAETRNYVKKVLNSYFQYRKSLPAVAGQPPVPGIL